MTSFEIKLGAALAFLNFPAAMSRLIALCSKRAIMSRSNALAARAAGSVLRPLISPALCTFFLSLEGKAPQMPAPQLNSTDHSGGGAVPHYGPS